MVKSGRDKKESFLIEKDNTMCTHYIVCKNQKALEFLKEDSVLLGFAAERNKAVCQGDALCARDILLEEGFEWGKDFYLRKVNF